MRAALVIALCAGWLVGQSEQAPIEALLRDLDERFERGDVPGYLGRFAPDNRGAVAMLRARLSNDVLARAERILLLCVFCGFGSRRSDGAVVCKRDVRAALRAAGSLLQPLAGSFAARQAAARRPAAMRCVRDVAAPSLASALTKNKRCPGCAKRLSSGLYR